MDKKFWLYEPSEGNTLNVLFSARTVPAGRFSMYNSAKKLDGSRLFFNCADNTWYQNDIEAITNLIKSHRKEPGLRISGISMGGYAAVLWGCMFPFARIISFSPNMILRTPYTHSWYYKFNAVPAYSNLIRTMKRRNPKNISVFFGARDIVDMYYYGLAARDGIEGVHALKCTHSTAAFLDTNELLIPYLLGEVKIADLASQIVYPDPDASIEQFYRYCAAVRRLSALDRGDTRRACNDLDPKLLGAANLRKLAQDLVICGFIDAASGIVTYGAEAGIFQPEPAARLQGMLERSASRQSALNQRPSLPTMVDEIGGRFVAHQT